MSINWVMLHETQGFVRLPGEKPIYKSSSRTSIAITTPRTYPGNIPLDIHCSSGTIYLTNQRVVYLPATPTEAFRSFSAPLLNLHDSHVTVPWFGPNAWQALLQPVPGGNIPSGHSSIEVKFTFKEGGVTDFHSNFERIKERLQQALEAANVGAGPGWREECNLAGVNMDAVHLDQLPSYEASGHDQIAPDRPPEIHIEPARPVLGTMLCPEMVANDNPQPSAPTERSPGFEPPAEAPPGYEEAQHQGVQEELERRLMR